MFMFSKHRGSPQKTKCSIWKVVGCFPLGFGSNDGGWLLLVWKVCCCWKSTQQKQGRNKQRVSLQSVSNSETDVTVTLTRFEELLTTMTVMQKNNKSGWMDPSDDWGQDGG